MDTPEIRWARKVVLDMANRYDEDVEGCSGEELIAYGEAISCCYRLAYILKYGKYPDNSTPWAKEFIAEAKQLYKDPIVWLT